MIANVCSYVLASVLYSLDTVGNPNGHKNIYIFCTKQHRHALLGCEQGVH